MLPRVVVRLKGDGRAPLFRFLYLRKGGEGVKRQTKNAVDKTHGTHLTLSRMLLEPTLSRM